MHRVFLAVLLMICRPAGTVVFGQVSPLSGDLIIFHAGSLSVPMKEISRAFMKLHPDVHVLLESAGSVASARKITDLHKPCDILASADYAVIDHMLIPAYTQWNIRFAGNEMALVYTGRSARAEELSENTWMNLLLNPEVRYGRSDPNSDPCGYRTIMTLRLAEQFYGKPGLEKALLAKDQRYIRPKEVDLIALLESHTIDYIFIYKSIALQHGLKYLSLPGEINLGNPDFSGLYATAAVEINGSRPGEKVKVSGEPMIYGITILNDAPNREVAIAFLRFLLEPGSGMKILEENGQPSVIPMKTAGYSFVPASLQTYCKPD